MLQKVVGLISIRDEVDMWTAHQVWAVIWPLKTKVCRTPESKKYIINQIFI